MSQERRRYFRINDTVKLSYKLVSHNNTNSLAFEDDQTYFNKEDKQIADIIRKLAKKQPEVAALMALFNQKLERLGNLLTLDGHRLDNISMELKKVNISACGMAFNHSSPIDVNSILDLEIALLPSDQTLNMQGRIVSCSQVESSHNNEDTYYVRVDFYAMDMMTQEKLIQHIVQNQMIA